MIWLANPRSMHLSWAALSKMGHHPWKTNMNLTIVHIGPIVALIAGILILIMPRLLNYIVAFYLIIVGILGLVR
jgi:hypothetical protein